MARPPRLRPLCHHPELGRGGGGGGGGGAQVATDYRDWVLSGFSGYLAADARYDGPFCVLSAVDARRQRRLLYEVLDHDPTRADVLWFLARVNQAITTRGGVVVGITTDGSSLYPLPIALALGPIPPRSASSTASRN